MTWDRTLGCPYMAGPACRDCDGTCWPEPEPYHQPEPVPCQGCSLIVGVMTECEDLCHGIHSEDDLDQRAREYRARTQP